MLLILALRGGSQRRTSTKPSSSFLGKTRADEVIRVKIKQRNTVFFSGFSQTRQQTEKGPLSEWLGDVCVSAPQGPAAAPVALGSVPVLGCGLWDRGAIILGQHLGRGCTNMQSQISFP